MIPETDKAYLAGIVDGEGCIGAVKLADKRPGRAPGAMFTVAIAMTDREALDLAHRLYGGSVRARPDKRGGNRRMMYVWQAYGDIGARFLRDVLPYLRIKSKQAEAYLLARTTFTGSPTFAETELRMACCRRIQLLNQRNPDACRQ